MEKVLVTGAYGFLGKYGIRELLDNGYGVISFGRKKQELNKLRQENVEICIGDLRVRNDVVNAEKNADYVIHAGTLSTVWGKREDFIKTNVLYACKKYKIKRLVYVSSPSIYSGRADRINIDENDFDRNNKPNYYIESKIMAERVICRTKDIPFVIIRPRGLFGIGDTSIIPRLINSNRKMGIPLFNNVRNIVDINCVENVALALRLALESPAAVGNTYNICTLGYSQTLNIEKTKRNLKYIPKLTLSEGIKKYAEDHKRNKVL